MNLSECLADPTLQKFFVQYCVSKTNEETNVLFWLDAEDFRRRTDKGNQTQFQNLIDKYFTVGSRREVQRLFDEAFKQQLREAADQTAMISAAQDLVFRHLEADVFPQFVSSPQYQEALRHRGPRTSTSRSSRTSPRSSPHTSPRSSASDLSATTVPFTTTHTNSKNNTHSNNTHNDSPPATTTILFVTPATPSSSSSPTTPTTPTNTSTATATTTAAATTAATTATTATTTTAATTTATPSRSSTATPTRTTIDTSQQAQLTISSPESPFASSERLSSTANSPSSPSPRPSSDVSSDTDDHMLTKRTSVYNRYGQKMIGEIKSPENEDKKKRNLLAQAERARESKWIRMLGTWPEFCAKNPRKLSSRVRKGIPEAVRGRAWSLMLGTDHPENSAKYAALLEAVADSENRDVIDRDVNRTFSDYVFFRQKEGQSPSQGRSALRNVLRAYACHDKELGYCQGMSFHAGVFLMYATEEQAFWMLEGLLRNPRWQLRGMFLPGFPLLNEYYYILEALMKENTPKLRQKLIKAEVATAMFAQEWFMTLFACCIPFESFLRVMDILLYKGYKILFQLAIAMLKQIEQSKELASMDFSTLVVSLKGLGGRDKYRENTYAVMDTEQLLKAAFQVQLTTAKLDKLSSEANKKAA